MELKKLYPGFFDKKKQYLAYEKKEKYRQDSSCSLRVLIFEKIQMKHYKRKVGKIPIFENRMKRSIRQI